MTDKYQLLPEWAEQEAVILAWPDKHTDWLPWLEDVQGVYLEIIQSLSLADTSVILLVRSAELEDCRNKLDPTWRVMLVSANYNDTWVRDYAFLSCATRKGVQAIEFGFNGWGGKFDATQDDRVNQSVLGQLCQKPIKSMNLVLEGGALEIDQEGLLLSTEFCLSNPRRNGDKSIHSYERDFVKYLGATRSIILANGHLEGDDTDGHIDTLVRFTPDRGLIVQSAFNRPQDKHFQGLTALVNECAQAMPKHKIFELPLAEVTNLQGERLPASYANFLISNQHILCPVYQQPEDKLAMEVMGSAYPNFTIVPINCLPLVQQFGSLHCITMQVPRGILKPEVLQILSNGVCVYA